MSALNAVLPGGTTPTHALYRVVFTVAETIREVREVPSGHLYACLCDRVALADYQTVLGVLSRARLIEVTRSHMIRWIGPEVAA